ncbi:MAG: ribosome small subunit-dependent GTPase A [Bacilli bacterium]|nr:ribosome small subunit-dependent GTPase A [Bacilli bacterium]
MKGQIIKIISNLYFVSCDGVIYQCHSRGNFRNKKITPVVGDYCVINEKDNYILEILPRKNVLVRPQVANIDQGLIVTSLKTPDFSTNLLDKLILIMEVNNIKPIICITKEDLLSDSEKDETRPIIDYYQSIGYDVFYNSEIEKIKKIFKDKTTVFTGQTGAGKSSLFNKLDRNLNFDVGEVSMALGRGKHTTRCVELVNLFDGKLVDTPGFSSIDLTNIDNDDIRKSFVEFGEYECKYKDCTHTNEGACDCKVKEAVLNGGILSSRYENYIKFLNKDKYS